MLIVLLGNNPLSMLAALLIQGVRATCIGLAADSHSCRDQGKPRGTSARVFQPIRGFCSGIDIPAFTITRDGDGAFPQQVISLGNTKWAQDILRPMSVMSQSETTTTKQHNTFIEPTPETELEDRADGKATGTATPRAATPEWRSTAGGPTAATATTRSPQQEQSQEPAYLPRRRSPSCRGPPEPQAAPAAAEEEERHRKNRPNSPGHGRREMSSSSMLSRMTINNLLLLH